MIPDTTGEYSLAFVGAAGLGVVASLLSLALRRADPGPGGGDGGARRSRSQGH